MTAASIAALVAALVPSLVQVAESKFGAGQGAQKRQWVIDGVHAALTALEQHVPAWAGTLITDVEPLIDDGIQAALTKLGLS
jgi:hypothetical protein